MGTAGLTAVRQRRYVAVLRAVMVVAGLYQLVFAEHAVGAVILLCLAAIMRPALFTRGRVKSIPLEFELILFAMVTLQFVIGETLNFYDIPYFDKLVHFTLPFFLGYITALFAYTMSATGNLHMSVGPGFVVIILVTLGIGALWEIFEYLIDLGFGTYLQGSHTASPLVDTMNDLIVDTLGGVFGALVAVRYVRSGQRDTQARLSALTDELAATYAAGAGPDNDQQKPPG